jgi:hypothetical protein
MQKGRKGMPSCAYCNSTIVFGAKRDEDLRFCNSKCREAGALRCRGDQLPSDAVRRVVSGVHEGLCPKCNGHGPIDVHTSYRVWSAVLLTSWRSKPCICCRGCGLREQMFSFLSCAVLGWWGFPWGFVITPMQLIRNLTGILSPPDPAQPSQRLEGLLRLRMAAQLPVPSMAPKTERVAPALG